MKSTANNKLFVIMSYTLTDEQISQTKSEYNIQQFVTLPDDLQKYGQISHPSVTH